MAISGPVNAAAAGTWRLGDLTVNRMGFGAMRLPQNGRPFTAGAAPGDRGRAITVLRQAVELGVNHIDTAAFYFSSLRSANELAWTLQRGPHMLAIPGTSNPGHLAANVAAAALRLTQDELTRLESLHNDA